MPLTFLQKIAGHFADLAMELPMEPCLRQIKIKTICLEKNFTASLQPMKFSAAMADYLNGEGRNLRNASRMYALMCFHSQGEGFLPERLDALLAPYFTKYQRKRYLDLLIQNGWINWRAGVQRAIPISPYRQTAKITGFKWGRTPFAVVPENALQTRASWLEFLAGLSVGAAAQRIKHFERSSGESKKIVREFRGDIGPLYGPIAVPVSCEIISSRTQTSIATSSRLRSRAAKGGYIQNEKNFQTIVGNKNLSYRDFLHVRAALMDNSIILRKGQLLRQLPNMVSLVGLSIKSSKFFA